MALVLSRILLAYDDSASSRAALHYACALAGTGAALAVAHAPKDSNFVAAAALAGSFPPVDPAAMIAAVDEQTDTVLKAAVAECSAHGISAEKVFVHESPGDGIVAAAHRVNAEMIVVGTHGRTGVARTIRGSVAERVLRASAVPVLVVTRHAKPPHRERTFSRALVAVDDSDTSKTALSFAALLAARLGTRLTLCSVVGLNGLEATDAGVYSFDSSMHTAAIALSQRAKATAGLADFLDDEIVVKGDPAAAIEHTAMQRNCDLIIVGSHGRQGLRRALEGSVAETLARTSAVPVLIVPAHSEG
jgi:nucleotide-binding universal stress UspA family protein